MDPYLVKKGDFPRISDGFSEISVGSEATLFLFPCKLQIHMRTRGSSLKQHVIYINMAQHLFFNTVVSTWNGLPEHNNCQYRIFSELLKSFAYCQLSICNHIRHNYAIVYHIIVFCFSYVHAQRL